MRQAMSDDESYKELLIKKDATEEDEDAHGSSSYTVEEAIEKMGFGWFQIRLLALCGVAWMADSMEMSILAILGPAVRCEWYLTHWHEAFLTTVVFIGMFISTYFWGYMADAYGRKTVVIFASLGIFYYGLVSSISPRYIWIVIFRGMVGFSMSGVVQGTTLISEYLPTKARGLTISFSSCFWSIGTSIEILTAMFVMPTLGWRWQLFFSSLPSLLFLSVAKMLPESARFYVASGQQEKAIEMLELVSKLNKEDLPDGKLIAAKTTCNRGSIIEMFKGGTWKTTVLLWIIWFGSHFNIYGLALLTTSLYSSGYACYGNAPLPSEDITNCVYCKSLEKTDYLNFFLVLTADFLCVLIVAALADTIGRKRLQGVGFLVMGMFYSMLYICTRSKSWTTFFLFGARCFAAVADLGGYIYTPEVYPTHIRGMALGSCSGISRIGCMLTPFVAQVLAHKSIHLTIGLYVGVSLAGFICSLLLPIETKGRKLVETEES
ncbi:synaptic vesicle 2-related protein-like isoform X2 [Rhopilema esculentum]|uniref:synaptic vesicle 2-related protein-like isoform X2 n=1 Tax=Rhopilema esculentum TaxID=499914 RepID=UPI0031E301BD